MINKKLIIMTPRIQRAIDIFLDAINKQTLAKGTCSACAVGNLVAHGMGYSIELPEDECGSYEWRKQGSYKSPKWGAYFTTCDGIQTVYPLSDLLESSVTTMIEEIESTEFSAEELMKIEYAFETNTEIHWDDYVEHTNEEIRADQIRGLEAVVRVMLRFDEQTDNVQEIFTSKAELIPLN